MIEGEEIDGNLGQLAEEFDRRAIHQCPFVIRQEPMDRQAQRAADDPRQEGEDETVDERP